ncbi:MAG: hypothetical protein ACFFDN_23775, partial [Candidatus Hodarchaeota archaeon]
MKSKTSNNSQERIRKATDILQKFWWFSFFLIIAPLTVAVFIFYILYWFDFFIALHSSIVAFIFALLFF